MSRYQSALYVGYTDDALIRSHSLDESFAFLQKPFSKGSVAGGTIRDPSRQPSEGLLGKADLDAGLYDLHASSLLPCDTSAMLYFEARSRRLLLRGLVFMDFGGRLPAVPGKAGA